MYTAARRTKTILTHLTPINTTDPLQHNLRHYTSSPSTTFSNPNQLKFYIDGSWVNPSTTHTTIPVVNPSTEQVIGHISNGSHHDVEKAVEAATRAFETFSKTTREERIKLLEKIASVYARRVDEIAEAISMEMGCPITYSKKVQAPIGYAHIMNTIAILKEFPFSEAVDGGHRVVKEAVGVVGMITPWNYPINQIACKVIPALACGCTMVLKPSEVAPLDGIIFAEILNEAGVPKGVFNLINGTGVGVGEAISRHPGIHAITFTGSTRAGIAIAKSAADTVKRVSQELGGKSPHIVLPDADLKKAITHGVSAVIYENAGQTCSAPTRLLIPQHLHDQALVIAKQVAESIRIGPSSKPETQLGPVASAVQWQRVQQYIQKGVEEGATLVTGGPGRPEGLTKGYFVKPTIFGNVKNSMTVAKEEIFGPVLCILPYKDESEAIKIANDTPYGLSSEVSGTDPQKMQQIASQLRAGTVRFNGSPLSMNLPFGGYKMSGNGREWGKWSFNEFLEVKSLIGVDRK